MWVLVTRSNARYPLKRKTIKVLSYLMTPVGRTINEYGASDGMKTGKGNEVLGENTTHKYHMTCPGMEPRASAV
jgi:hypothetical protein